MLAFFRFFRFFFRRNGRSRRRPDLWSGFFTGIDADIIEEKLRFGLASIAGRDPRGEALKRDAGLQVEKSIQP